MNKGYEIEFLYSRFLLANGVSIDTRTLVAGDLYFALRGDRYDGHDFVQEAFQKGASYAVVATPAQVKDHPQRCLLVPDTLVAMRQLAAFHRSRYKRHLVAITGTNGKTTTCSLLAAALRMRYIVHASAKSHNNHIGIPLTLLRILPQTEVVVLEMGTSSPGEIAQHCDLARPTHGLLTSLGAAHLEGLGDVAGVLAEKRSLFDYLRTTGGQFFLNTASDFSQPADFEQLTTFRREALALRNPSATKTPTPAASCKTYAAPTDDHPLSITETPTTLQYRLPSGTHGEVALQGMHHQHNLAAAIALARAFEVPDKDIVQALNNWQPLPLRAQWKIHNTYQLLLDCYNANPNSMSEALNAFLRHTSPPHAVILGDMHELGASSHKHHTRLGEQLAQISSLHILLCGKEMAATAHVCSSAQHFHNKEALAQHLRNHPLPPQTTILLKASRSMALETLIKDAL